MKDCKVATKTTTKETIKDHTKTNETNKNKESKETKNIYFLVCILIVCLGILLQHNLQKYETSKEAENLRKYWVYDSNITKANSRTGYLKHVHKVLNRLGYSSGGDENDTSWSLLWAHKFPFGDFNLRMLKPHQKVNHFPGTGCITRKVALATEKSKYIPRAFQLPKDRNELLEYSKKNKDAMFLVKNNLHRGVHLKNVSEINLDRDDSFVQEYLQRPFLVDGHKFDIGVYVVITSVDPLRVYWYKGDVLFRYCPAKYYPFDPKNLDKYVIADDYRPTWEVPSLAHTYTALGFSMKDAFDVYAKSKGYDTEQMWEDVLEAIAEVFVINEKRIIAALKNYRSGNNFFEMMRFDLIVDEDLRVYLLEANMSPNLSSDHFPPNQLLYEQVLYNLFSLTGVSSHLVGSSSSEDFTETKAAQEMISSQKNIAVFGVACSRQCLENCEGVVCGLCNTCMGEELRQSLLQAHREFLHRGDFRRFIPPSMNPDTPIDEVKLKDMSYKNKMQYLWFQGKCNIDYTWCT